MKRFSFSLSSLTFNKTGVTTGLLVAAMGLASVCSYAQVTGSTQTTTDAQGQKQESVSVSANVHRKKKKKAAKADRVQESKDTRAELKKEQKNKALVAKDAELPDKVLFDKAKAQQKSGHYDVARLDLQTLLNTYPDSQYQMQAKLAVADSWYHEGGTAALAQAEQEYTDFITFFPNSPEAAEAQMRVGDIYFKQMDIPDRDYNKAVKAEESYRTMLKQYPDAPPELLKEVKQKLREVQEVLATREADLGAFYASRSNWPAAIARYQTVADTYPQYSHMDDVLIGIGDAYEAEAKIVRGQTLPEGARAKLLQDYEGKAAEEYRKVVLEHAAAPHVEDAKERLEAMNLPVPVPTKEQVAASEALEGSRAQYTMSKRLELLVMHKPDTVTAAQIGNPPLEDPTATVAPTIVKDMVADYREALNPNAATAPRVAVPKPEAPANPTTEAAPTAPAAPLALKDVPAAGSETDNGTTSTMEEASPASGESGTGVGIEVVTPGANAAPVRSGVTTPASTLPAASGAPDPNNGLTSVGPKNATPLPPVEKAAGAPDQVNEVAGQPQPAAQPAAKKGKKTPKPAFDKDDESSSKHKKKKGVDKLNPF